MKRIGITVFTALICFGISLNIIAQTSDSVKPSVVTGEVVSVSAEKIELKTATGSVTANLTAATEYKRVSPTNPSLKTATPATLSDISNGDKLMVTGVLAEDKKSLPARAIYLMTKSDIAERNASQNERWTTRGISGRVASVNQDTKQITIEVRGLMGTTNTVISPTQNVTVKRYAPNSINYSQAVAGTIAAIQPGEMLRAVGDRSQDGASFIAEEIITGAFQTVAGSVKAVDVENNQITITNLQTNTDVIVSLASASTLKRFPEEMAQRMAMTPGGQPGAGQGPGQGPGRRPGAGGTPQGQPGQGTPGQGGRGGFGGAPRGGIDEMLERFPTIGAGDLKVGEMVAISSSKNGDEKNVTAIKLLAGVEPFIRAAQASGQMQRGGRGGQSGGFTIPGLDGFDGF